MLREEALDRLLNRDLGWNSGLVCRGRNRGRQFILPALPIGDGGFGFVPGGDSGRSAFEFAFEGAGRKDRAVAALPALLSLFKFTCSGIGRALSLAFLAVPAIEV